MCECGHDINRHCDGQSYDSEYGTFRCLCPAYIKENQ
jgi:hypothetical protein